MHKLLSWLIGPEIYWAFWYGFVLLLIRLTGSPVRSMDSVWIASVYVIPLILLPVSFALYGWAGTAKGWFILRLWIAGLAGGHWMMERALQAHSEQGPGVGTAYMLGMGLQFVVLVIATIVAMVRW